VSGACGTHGRGGGGKPESKSHLKDQGVDGRMGLEWILGRLVGGVWNEFTWLRIEIVGGLL
jgi:hypothetical protein